MPSPRDTFCVVCQTNPSFRVNELFIGCEDLRSPRFAQLRQRFAIDEAVRGVDGEIDRILALRHWIAGQQPYQPIG